MTNNMGNKKFHIIKWNSVTKAQVTKEVATAGDCVWRNNYVF